jgi:hypothetical protein
MPDEDWRKVDLESNNILHVAITNIESIRWLLKHVDTDQVLTSARAVDG